jgi:hypothetical protein
MKWRPRNCEEASREPALREEQAKIIRRRKSRGEE